MSRLNVDRVVANFKDRLGAKVAAALTDFKKVTPTLARVVLTLPNVKFSTKYDLRQVISASLNGEGTPINQSFHRVDSHGLPALVGFVRMNRTVKPYETASVKKMRVMAANMLMDPSDDTLWQVVTSPDGQRMLARQSQDDFSTVLASVKQSVPRSPKVNQIAVVAYLGDFVSFVDPKTERIAHGFVLANEEPMEDGDSAFSVVRVPTDMEDLSPEEQMEEQNAAFTDVVVPASLVVSSAGLPTRFFSTEVAAPFDKDNIQALKDYYAKLYQKHGPEFYEKLRQNIDKMAAA